jgi:hypothetical protein
MTPHRTATGVHPHTAGMELSKSTSLAISFRGATKALFQVLWLLTHRLIRYLRAEGPFLCKADCRQPAARQQLLFLGFEGCFQENLRPVLRCLRIPSNVLGVTQNPPVLRWRVSCSSLRVLGMKKLKGPVSKEVGRLKHCILSPL